MLRGPQKAAGKAGDLTPVLLLWFSNYSDCFPFRQLRPIATPRNVSKLNHKVTVANTPGTGNCGTRKFPPALRTSPWALVPSQQDPAVCLEQAFFYFHSILMCMRDERSPFQC